MKRKSGEKTLLASVILSSPGPLVLGLGLLFGRSSTQLADFVRRTVELIAIIVSWAVYGTTQKGEEIDLGRKERLEHIANLSVGVAMCLSGVAMLLITFLARNNEKGNVVPALIIAILGVLTNSWFWFRYRKLDRENPNAILAVQSRLYRAKSFVDACVTLALTTVAIVPTSLAAVYMDIAGSSVVAMYLVVNGVIAICNRNEKVPDSR